MEANAAIILANVFQAITFIFGELLTMSADMIGWLFDWTANPAMVIIAIPLALMIIVFVFNMVRRLIAGV